jgi:hypothetical protein
VCYIKPCFFFNLSYYGLFNVSPESTLPLGRAQYPLKGNVRLPISKILSAENGIMGVAVLPVFFILLSSLTLLVRR